MTDQPAEQEPRFDSFVNLLTNLGVEGSDKRLNAVAAEPTRLGCQELNRLYRGDDVIARICNLPSNEMVKKWFQIKAAEDGDREKIDAMMQVQKDLGTKAAVREALVWSQLHGGSVIVIGADDGREQHEPLNEEGIRSIDYLTVLDRWDLEIVSVYNVANEPSYRLPEIYRIRTTIQPSSGAGFFSKMKAALSKPLGIDPVIHETRVIRFDGALTPPIIRLANLGWSDSVVTRVYEVVRDFQTSYAGVGILMQDIGQAVFKMKDLAQRMAHDKEGLVLTRLHLMNVARSVARMVPIDMDGEDLIYPNQRVQGIPGILEKFDVRLAMALGWPATVLLGQSSKGLNATGESDLTNWYDFIQGEQERNLEKQLTKLVRIIFKMLGKEPKTWAVSFPPLWQATAKEVAEERKEYAETDALNIDRGVYTAEEASESRYSGDEFGTEINLDKELRDTDKIPSADPKDVPDLRDPEAKIEKPQDEAMAAGQITALVSIVDAFNSETITREQAISILVVTFQMDKAQAAELVGFEPHKKEPAPVPAGEGYEAPIAGIAEAQQQRNKTAPEPDKDPRTAIGGILDAIGRGEGCLRAPSEPDSEYRKRIAACQREPNTDSIEKSGEKWIVLSGSGDVLGVHDTKAEAEEQLRAIEAAKHRGE